MFAPSLRRTGRRRHLALILAACLSAGACRSDAGGGASYPDGVITILVGQSPGGGFDLTARLFAAHLSRHLPGQVPVIVENVLGAGSLAAVSRLAHQAAADGQTIGYFGETMVLAQLMGEPGARFDAREFPVVASPIGEDADVCVLSVRSGMDLQGWKSATTPPRIGVTAYGSPTQFRAMLVSSALDLPIKPVVGYQGTSQIRMALESGEVDGTCISAAAYLLNPLPVDRFRVVLRAGGTDVPSLAGVPSAESQTLTPEGRELLALLNTVRMVARFFVVRPGTPADRVAVLRTAFEQTLQDPVFLAAAATARATLRPRAPADVELEIRKLLDLPADQRQRLKALLLPPGDR